MNFCNGVIIRNKNVLFRKFYVRTLAKRWLCRMNTFTRHIQIISCASDMVWMKQCHPTWGNWPVGNVYIHKIYSGDMYTKFLFCFNPKSVFYSEIFTSVPFFSNFTLSGLFSVDFVYTVNGIVHQNCTAPFKTICIKQLLFFWQSRVLPTEIYIYITYTYFFNPDGFPIWTNHDHKVHFVKKKRNNLS